MDESLPPPPEQADRPAPDAGLARAKEIGAKEIGAKEVGAQEVGAKELGDRRRPGRVAYHNPALIALLRSPAAARDDTANRHEEQKAEDVDESGWREARGIARGLLFVAPFWIVVGLLWWLL